MKDRPYLSIVIPARNEAQFIGTCLDSIVTNGFDLEQLEVLVVDGMSTDRTAEILGEWQKRHTFIRVIQNFQRTTSIAFNIGILASRGNLVTLMSAHSTYEAGSLAALVDASARYGADNVGGVLRLRPRNQSIAARAIVAVLSHPFGVGGGRFRHDGAPVQEPIDVDTAAFGCYRREVFERIGLFNEQLIHSQDIEFNQRLTRAGGRILLVPGVAYTYFARSTPSDFLAHNFRNGRWVVLPFAYATGLPVSPRHLVPGLFVLTVLILLIVGLYWGALLGIAAIVLGIYALAALVGGFHLALTRRDPWLALTAPIAFLSLHWSYGIGSLTGLWSLVTRSHRNRPAVQRV